MSVWTVPDRLRHGWEMIDLLAASVFLLHARGLVPISVFPSFGWPEYLDLTSDMDAVSQYIL